MKFYNINDKRETVSFKQAVLQGAASGKGLFFPSVIPKLSESFFKHIDEYNLHQIASDVLREYVSEDFSLDQLNDICKSAFNFPIPLTEIEPSLYALELYHGPSLAFKDVGARFLSEVFKKIASELNQKITVLVATSGDTGSAVAQSFYNVDGVDVVLLYPSGKVSKLQEKTLTTLGGNITALEVDGAFDDCQRLVKQAFNDEDVKSGKKLTSANSINVGRFLPQTIYYFWAWRQLPQKERENLVISVPGGNYGNLSAGLLANRMGLPVKRFVASSNINRVFPDYLESGEYKPRPAVRTLSNAMDVGNPSNFVRITELFHQDIDSLKKIVKSHVVTDEQTLEAISSVYSDSNYLLDPHGAVGYLGCKAHLKPGEAGIFVETAHPGKFRDSVEQAINETIDLPEYLNKVQKKEKQAIKISADYKEFKGWLLSQDS